MPARRTDLRALTAAVAVLVLVLAPTRVEAAEAHWVGAWAASPQSNGPRITNETQRLFVHTSTGGSKLRLRFSNRYGTDRLTLRNVTVALPMSPLRPGVQAKTLRPVRFAAGDAVTIPAGQERRSLPVDFAVPADAWLAVSFHVPGSHATSTQHGAAWGLNWHTVANGGDRADDWSGDGFVSTASWAYLTGVDVVAPPRMSTVVALGDSITDSMTSVPETNSRWPDLLNRRLMSVPGGQRFSVVNAGINGNLVTAQRGQEPANGEAAIRRMYWDVFDLPNVSTLILYEGVNDIIRGVPAGTIIEGYKRILAATHMRGIRVLISTMTPSGASAVDNPSNAASVGTRNELNRWIDRNAARFDGVIRFSETVQNPLDPAVWAARYSSGDQTHPNPNGLRAMADSIPLSLFSR